VGKAVCEALYIPHSSDKTMVYFITFAHKLTLYIPHSSDKTQEGFNLGQVWDKILYIPHSSDKTQHLPPKSNIDNTPILEFCQVVQVK